MKTTPLHEQHINLGARMGEFGGWDMPIQYAGILQEHQQTRTKATLFDICHMGEFELRGPTAAADLERLLTCRIATLAIGQVRYGFLLNEAGGVIDDLTCYRLGKEYYLLVVNAGKISTVAAWIQKHISSETRFIDLTENLAKLDVQGPLSRKVLEEVNGAPLLDVGYFKAEEVTLLGTPCILSRTGYTGEWGYELYFPAKECVRFWNKILEHPDIAPGGLGARDTLRLEMGYSLYGHELSLDRTPYSTSRGMFISMVKDFIGKAAVQADMDQPKELLVALQLSSKRATRAHDAIFHDGCAVGEVTSGSVAPSLGTAVALAFVEPRFVTLGQDLQVEIRGKLFDAIVVDLPFYKNGTARG